MVPACRINLGPIPFKIHKELRTLYVGADAAMTEKLYFHFITNQLRTLSYTTVISNLILYFPAHNRRPTTRRRLEENWEIR